jgi:hypothetical protein
VVRGSRNIGDSRFSMSPIDRPPYATRAELPRGRDGCVAGSVVVNDSGPLRRNRDRTGLTASRFPFALRGGSRFCPDCLAGTQGRRQLHWRLGWSFVCTSHGCVLVDVCMNCQRRPRGGGWPFVTLPSRCPCGADLTANHAASFPHSHPVAAAQDAVINGIVRKCATFGIYATDPRAARSVLGDVATLANRALTHTSIHGFSAVKPPDLVDFVGATGLDVRTRPEGRGTSTTTAPARALDTAVGVTAAISILEAPDLDAAAERAACLLAGNGLLSSGITELGLVCALFLPQ